jgi:anti-sigma B factor antagonist
MPLPGNGTEPAQPAASGMGHGVEADGLMVEREVDGSVVTVRVSGEIDALTAPRVDSALAEAYAVPEVAHVLLDLSEVEFLGSAGLSVLVSRHEHGETAGVPLAVVASRHATLRAIEVTSLDQVLRLYPSATEALRALG